MGKQHNYHLTMNWTGNKGSGTSDYKAYERSHVIQTDGKAEIQASSDPAFRGDNTKYNPEELLVAALSSCHLLSYLHQCAVAGVVVTAYTDTATGTMKETPDGGGHFTEVTLNPVVTVKDPSMMERAKELHHKASLLCFIANSVNFPVHHRPVITAEQPQTG
ncbi:MAG: OsmC family protein [Williamsia sp.]|nr:OsmC family protein [Williamsia sp.]